MAPHAPADAAFLDDLNRVLGREGVDELAWDTDLAGELDSLERVLVWTHLDDLGAELPPGIEDSLPTPADLYDHYRRRTADGSAA